MPTLQFKGRNSIWSHHLSVPYHALEEVREWDYRSERGEGNLIVEGDNLLALRALQPRYGGKIKCIYIDPPYNTGNEGWVYNDKVNNPMIRSWLGKTVDKEDLTRHDKWLCMMVPRLQLLRELLTEDGVIFVSIDDNEVHNLRSVMDDIFGEENFVSTIIWHSKYTTANDASYVSYQHENVLFYAKDKRNFKIGLFERTEKQDSAYKNPDNDKKGPWKVTPLHAKTGQESGNYSIRFPNGITWTAPAGRYPRYSKKRLLDIYNEGGLHFNTRGNVDKKTYLSEVKQGLTVGSVWYHQEVGHTHENNEELANLFGKGFFDNPKGTKLIKRILIVANTKEDDIILDSFAGSGTTMDAVMALNKEDGGNRRCIMVQMTEATPQAPDKNICRDITRERIQRAIDKYGYESGFKYLCVGASMDPEDMLDGKLPSYERFAEYVFYLATGQHIQVQGSDPHTHYVGMYGQDAIYLLYEQNMEVLTEMALTQKIAEQIIAHNTKKRKIIFAPACFLDNEYMEEKNIDFVSVPYNLFECT